MIEYAAADRDMAPLAPTERECARSRTPAIALSRHRGGAGLALTRGRRR